MAEQFNELMLEFLDELALVFPENPELTVYKKLSKDMVKASPHTPAKMFNDSTQQHAHKILAQDATFFDDCPKILSVDIRSLWQKDLSDSTRKVIWTYLQNLQMMAAGSTLPPETMTQLHSMAEGLSADMRNGTFDPSMLMKMLGFHK